MRLIYTAFYVDRIMPVEYGLLLHAGIVYWLRSTIEERAYKNAEVC